MGRNKRHPSDSKATGKRMDVVLYYETAGKCFCTTFRWKYCIIARQQQLKP